MSVLAYLSGPRRKVAIGSAAALVAVGAWIALPSDAATVGTVALTPASGSFSAPTTFTASAACPATATRYKITIVGGGVATETNMTGNETFPEGVKQVQGIALAAGTFQEFANQAAVTLTGTATVKVKCITGVSTVMPDDFASPVTFTGTGENTTYSSAASGTPTPTPVPGTPTPTPAPGTPTPTPAPGTPTPTPAPGTPTPAPGTPTPAPGTPTPTPAPGTPTPTPAPGTPTPAPGPDNSANESVPAGGKAETNTAVTQADPVGTTVTSPVAGQVTISEGNTSGTPPTGYSFFGQQVTITAPSATAAVPLTLQFRLDASLINGTIPTVFRNGTPVASCTPGQSAAAPDPCLQLFENIGNNDILLTVRTSTASTWNFGRPVNPKPPTDIAAACRAGGPVPAGWNLVEGTQGADVLIGTAGADLIRGLAGEDTLVGGSGNDLICGGAGDDLISGNTGHDLLLGEGGDDAIYGGAGDDAIGGHAGNDVLNGGLGDDLLSGGSGHDLMFGGRDDDLLFGDTGNDRIYGEDGYDRLYGGPGSDVLVVGRRF